MSVKIIQDRLDTYQCQTRQDIEYAMREITQEIALMSLSRSGFFKYAAFHGGSCLRILNGLNRYSEDLDFILKTPNQEFNWKPFLNNVIQEFSMYGYKLTFKDPSKIRESIQKVFIKDNSIGKIMNLYAGIPDQRTKSIKVKLEIDTSPPEGSGWQSKYLDFPLPYPVTILDPDSAFALKNHALLCRSYVKGRDWWDFIWCITRQFKINFPLLSNAINQLGPWQEQGITVTKDWYINQISLKIEAINWKDAKADVARFLKPADLQTLDLWEKNFFLHYLGLLSQEL